MSILNGRTKGDPLGEFTFERGEASATLDYAVVEQATEADMQVVQEGLAYSDHALLDVELFLHRTAPLAPASVPLPSPSQPLVLTQEGLTTFRSVDHPGLHTFAAAWATSPGSAAACLTAFEVALEEAAEPFFVRHRPRWQPSRPVNPTKRQLTR